MLHQRRRRGKKKRGGGGGGKDLHNIWTHHSERPKQQLRTTEFQIVKLFWGGMECFYLMHTRIGDFDCLFFFANL